MKDKKESISYLPLRKLLHNMKRLFILWIAVSLIVAFVNIGIVLWKKNLNSEVTSIINFSFDGIESGLSPDGNKFNVNEMKSEAIIQQSIDELGFTGCDINAIRHSISIDGIIPDDVIQRIVKYIPIVESKNTTTSSSKLIKDTTYYPTQYKITFKCKKAGLSKKDGAKLINKITKKYNDYFNAEYGYNTSLEESLKSLDYKEYDYIDSIDIMSATLDSLNEYITELEKSDNTRFRASNGKSFADISASIQTVRNEDLDWISSFVILKNVTKDKETLITNYKFKVDELKRRKVISQETINAITDTINIYEKNSILVYNGSDKTDSDPNSNVLKPSDTYDKLLDYRISEQTALSQYEQNINLYNERIKNLESVKTSEENNAIAEEELEKVYSKITVLLDTANETVSDYYENVLLNNAYTIISPATSSLLVIIKGAINDSLRIIFAQELIVAAVFITLSAVFCFVKIPVRKNKKSKK